MQALDPSELTEERLIALKKIIPTPEEVYLIGYSIFYHL
jgi:hypothetical protein